MNKAIQFIIGAILCSAVAACSGGSKYDAAMAHELASKIETGYEMNQDDYSQMITQCEGAAAIIEGRIDEILKLKEGGDQQKLQEAFEKMSDTEVMDAGETFQVLGTYLQTASLDEKNAARWGEFQPKAEALVEKMFRIFQ